MSLRKVKDDDTDSKALKLTEKEVTEVNNTMTSILMSVLHYFDHAPSTENVILCKAPITENQWKRMILLNLFDACAMSYRASAGKFTDKDMARIANRTVAGHDCEGFYTGSLVEGVGCATQDEYSDTDIMNVLKNFKAVYKVEKDKDVEEDLKSQTGQPLSANIDTIGKNSMVVEMCTGSHPGYTRLEQSEATEQLLKVASSLNYGPVIRSAKVEQLLAHEFEYDDAIAVECQNWPRDSLMWITRGRHSGWPNLALVEECAQIPCYIVSKSHAGNPEDRFEWRYSFARQEGLIFRKMPIKVKMVYILTKLLVKNLHIEENLLSTYQMKTMFLWHCEQKSENEFNKKELEINVDEFISYIINCLKEHKIENYFIPNNNMISHIAADSTKLVEGKVQSILANLFAICSSIKTASSFPFSVQGIAAALDNKSIPEPMLLHRIQSNFVHISTKFILSSYLPHSECMWMFLPYVLHRKNNPGTPEKELLRFLSLLQIVQNQSSQIADVYQDTFVHLITIFFVAEVETFSDIMSQCRKVLMKVYEELDNISVPDWIADVICKLGIEKSSSASLNCCFLIGDWVVKYNNGRDILMLSSTKAMSVVNFAKNNRESIVLLSRLNEIANFFNLSTSDIEVALGTVLRLQPNSLTVKTLETFCSLRNDVSLDGAQKQLVYGIFLFFEGGNVLNESESSLKSSTALFESKIYTTAAVTFCFVTSVIVHEKLSNGARNVVQKFLDLLEATDADSVIKELETDIRELMCPPNLDASKAFQFMLKCTYSCIISTSLGFILSVLDELVPPHINLGLLATIGLGMNETSEIDLAVECLELWLHRSPQASVKQNKALPVKIYGKLGHLHHIKAQSTTDKNCARKCRSKADVYFQTALMEDVEDIPVIGDYLLFCRSDGKEFNKYVQLVLSSSKPLEVSHYCKSSVPVLKYFEELQNEIEANGDIQVCTEIFVRYMSCHEDRFTVEVSLHNLNEMEATLGKLKVLLVRMEEAGSNVGMQKTVLSDSWRVLGYCASRIGKEEDAFHALSQSRSLSPERCVSDYFCKLFKDLKVKHGHGESADGHILYTRK